MNQPARLLGPAITVLLVLGGAAAATYDDDESARDAAGEATSSTTQPGGVAIGQTTSTTSDEGSATSTSIPAAGATAAPTTAATETTAAPPATEPAPRPADLIVHLSGDGPVAVTVENAGPGSAPEVVLVLSGVEGLQAAQLSAGAGVDCFGDGTVTCTIEAEGLGEHIGEVEVPLPAGQCLVAEVSSAVEDPQPDDNRRQRGEC